MERRATPPWTLLLLPALASGCLSQKIDDFIAGLELTTTGETSNSSSSSSTTGDPADAGESTRPGESSGSDSTDTTADPTTGTSSSDDSSSSGEPPAACGDGVVSGDEECDDGNIIPGDGCSATCAADLRVFVTSQLYKAGDLMSPYKADAVCLNRAKDAGLPEPQRFKAWLSDSRQHARDRMNRTRGRLVMVNGLVFADDWETLLTGVLENPLEVTEKGETYHGKVWTGTKVDGTAASDTTHCDDWTSISLTKSAYYGYSDEISFEWTLADQPDNPAACPIAFAIYCFESL